MKPKPIILVRHGESLGNVDPNHYETTQDYALSLTQEGKLQAQQAALTCMSVDIFLIAIMTALIRDKLCNILSRNIYGISSDTIGHRKTKQ